MSLSGPNSDLPITFREVGIRVGGVTILDRISIDISARNADSSYWTQRFRQNHTSARGDGIDIALVRPDCLGRSRGITANRARHSVSAACDAPAHAQPAISATHSPPPVCRAPNAGSESPNCCLSWALTAFRDATPGNCPEASSSGSHWRGRWHAIRGSFS